MPAEAHQAGNRARPGKFSWIAGEGVRKLLIIRTTALGDVIHALPALAALRERFPGARIHWLVEPAGSAIIEGHPFIDRLIVMPRKRWMRDLRSPLRWPALALETLRFWSSVRGERYDLIVDFQGNIRSGLAMFLGGGRHRLGFHPLDCREWGGRLFSNRKAGPAPLFVHKAVKNLHLVRELGWEGEPPAPMLPISAADRDWARQVIAGLPGSGPVVAMHPVVSAFGLIKRWPAEHYRRLADLLAAELGARLLISWGPGEQEMAKEVGRGTLCPPTTIRQLAALLAESDLFISSDTGCLHIAAALGTPVVGIYGPKNPLVYGPFPAGKVVTSAIPCSPCKLRRCAHRICMSTIFPEDVFRAAREALRGERPALAGKEPGGAV